MGVVVEGKSELIYVRNLLRQLLDASELSFQCFQLDGDDLKVARYSQINKKARTHFVIINVGNDEKVVSFIRENEVQLFSRGYIKIIGLRDMYSQVYGKLSRGRIDDKITEQITDSHNRVILEFRNNLNIKLYFSIMEIESWWITMTTLFLKIDGRLTSEYIERKLKVDIEKINPETHFYKPSAFIKKIFKLIGRTYGKTTSDVESITSKIDKNDLEKGLTKDSRSFKEFHTDLFSIIER